jgi:hypothetical protein
MVGWLEWLGLAYELPSKRRTWRKRWGRMWPKDEEEGVGSNWMKLGKREDAGNWMIMHCVENSLWKRLRTCRKTEYEMEIWLWSFGVPILAGAYRSSRLRACVSGGKKNPTFTNLELNPRFNCDRTAADCLSRGTANRHTITEDARHSELWMKEQ